MSRNAGTGAMTFGAVLAVVGAILRYAVKVHTSGFNIHTAGVILLVAGIVLIVAGLGVMFLGGSSRTTLRKSVQATPGGSEQIEERSDRATF